MNGAGARVLIVHPEQWPRALLRAELRERGYDAVGAPALPDALVYRPVGDQQPRIELIVLDERALERGAEESLVTLTARHADPLILLLCHGSGSVPTGPWAAVVDHPVDSLDVVRAVEQLLPLDADPFAV